MFELGDTIRFNNPSDGAIYKGYIKATATIRSPSKLDASFTLVIRALGYRKGTKKINFGSCTLTHVACCKVHSKIILIEK